MRRWSRRLVYLLLLLLWLLFISLPFFAFTLAGNKQIELGDPSGIYLRIFVLQEKDSEGVGVEFARPYAPAPSCHQTEVRYFMWVGTGEDVTYCQCLDDLSQPLSATAGPCTAAFP